MYLPAMPHLHKITSKTALIETANALRRMADQFENQAKLLGIERNYIGIEEHDRTDYARALNFLKSHPNFPNLTASECRKISDRFRLNEATFLYVARPAQSRHKKHIADQKARALVKLIMNGKPQNKAAKIVGLSTSRASQIWRAHKGKCQIP